MHEYTDDVSNHPKIKIVFDFLTSMQFSSSAFLLKALFSKTLLRMYIHKFISLEYTFFLILLKSLKQSEANWNENIQ